MRRAPDTAGSSVIESWNGANDFILYGRGGEIATNRLEDQEATMLALHLLQNCMVYVNTLMLQRRARRADLAGAHGGQRAAGNDTALLGPCEPLRHLPARHDRPPTPRSAYVGRPRRPATAARRLTLRGTRYFAFSDTNVGVQAS
jgi:Tn3 transposase DDE domain